MIFDWRLIRKPCFWWLTGAKTRPNTEQKCDLNLDGVFEILQSFSDSSISQFQSSHSHSRHWIKEEIAKLIWKSIYKPTKSTGNLKQHIIPGVTNSRWKIQWHPTWQILANLCSAAGTRANLFSRREREMKNKWKNYEANKYITFYKYDTTIFLFIFIFNIKVFF